MAAAHPFGSFVGCRFKRIGIAHFARLQETTSQCALTLCHAVLRVQRLCALDGPALRPPASRCAPGLIRHQRMHNIERHYTCEVCNKAFRQQIGLNIHQHMHSVDCADK